MKYFTEQDFADAVKLFAKEEQATSRLKIGKFLGSLGGIKRRAKARAMLAFVEKIEFEDISLHSMKAVLRVLFGTSVNNNMLMKFTTPGRKANNRVDKDVLLGNISLNCKSEAKEMLVELNEEWFALKKAAAEEHRKLPELPKTAPLNTNIYI